MGDKLSKCFENPENDVAMKKIFEYYDKNKNGKLDKDEFEILRKDFSKYITKKKKENDLAHKIETLPQEMKNELNKIDFNKYQDLFFSEIDYDNDGFIVYEEFQNWCIKISNEINKKNISKFDINEIQLKKVIRLQARIRQFIYKTKYKRYKLSFKRNPILKERNKIVLEFISKERAYYKKLEIIIKEFFEPMVEKSTCSKEDLKNVFSSIKDIRDVHNIVKRKFDHLDKKYPFVDSIGADIIKIAEHLKVYGEYVNTFKIASDTLNQLLDNNKKFNVFVTEKENTLGKLIDNTTLLGLLSLPMNHLNTYQYYLKLIKKKTPQNQPGYNDLEKAYRTMDLVTIFIGDSLANSSSRAKISVIQKTIVSPKEYCLPKQQKLHNKDNFFIFTTEKNISVKTVLTFILFDKCIVISKVNNKNNLEVKHQVPLDCSISIFLHSTCLLSVL
eukprot:TRINITY_DN12159_c0_g1_i2.p1 TRINITY_DN12159_c0_g1~~TRINITY_DN12159_c0_g1_i2.p1  ORF type:complete len:445 (-),score=110.91 TRINITY_DN12159_c0_g1_i2:66-1400(-)